MSRMEDWYGMTSQDHHPEGLSVHRAFVVQFALETEIGAGRAVGRVEHVTSGQAIHFQSLDNLLIFIDRMLQAGRGTTPESEV